MSGHFGRAVIVRMQWGNQAHHGSGRAILGTNRLVCCRSSNRDSHLVLQSPSQGRHDETETRSHCRYSQMSLTTQIPMTILLVVLPYGTAIICGAITQWAGKTVSGWCSVGGLALGIYFFHKSMELFVTG
jgi:hypothetical protein